MQAQVLSTRLGCCRLPLSRQQAPPRRPASGQVIVRAQTAWEDDADRRKQPLSLGADNPAPNRPVKPAAELDTPQIAADLLLTSARLAGKVVVLTAGNVGRWWSNDGKAALQEWGQTVQQSIDEAGQQLNRQLAELQNNVGEAVQDLSSGIAAANEMSSREVAEGAERWEETVREVSKALDPASAPNPPQQAAITTGNDQQPREVAVTAGAAEGKDAAARSFFSLGGGAGSGSTRSPSNHISYLSAPMRGKGGASSSGAGLAAKASGGNNGSAAAAGITAEAAVGGGSGSNNDGTGGWGGNGGGGGGRDDFDSWDGGADGEAWWVARKGQLLAVALLLAAAYASLHGHLLVPALRKALPRTKGGTGGAAPAFAKTHNYRR